MWKLFLLLALVASISVIYCDDLSTHDCQDIESTIVETSEESESSSSSSSSFSSSSSSSTDGQTSRKSSKSSKSSSSASESSSSKFTSKTQKINGSDDDYNGSSNDGNGSDSPDVESTTQVSSDTDGSDGEVNSDSSGADADCEVKCGVNEVFSNCTNGGCDARNCSQAGKPVPCVKLDPKNCKKGCVCQPDYLRASNGNCVPRNQCNEGCGDDLNAHPGCGVNCGKTCVKSAVCPRICKPNGCDCNDGFVLDANLNKCVKPKDCSPICGLNERFDSCVGFGCGHRNCSQLGKPQLCRDPAPGACRNGCSCIEGHLRTDNGTCVPQNQCPGANGCNGDPNAKPGCGVNCGKTCSTYKLKNVACPLICALNGCDCKEGHVFDDNLKKCVLPKDCSPICGRNERFDSCVGFGCGHRNCSQLGKPQLCRDPAPGACRNGCSCIEGHLRTDNGTCVPQNQCPGANGCNGDPNAKPGCGVNCGKTCSTYKLKNVACPLICALNGCDCKEGHVFDDNLKKCVLPKDCSPICGPNERFDSCVGFGCGYWNCSQLGQPQLCIDPAPGACRNGCTCVEGYLKADNGTCVPQNQCPGANGCNGDPNAKPGCGVNCGKTCSTYKLKNVACPAICALNGCDCKEGHVFDDNLKKCVLPKDCSPICGRNERFDSCVGFGCGHRNCSQLGKPQLCIDPAPGACRNGCTCVEGYLKADNGTCVPQNQCPGANATCNGDPNAKPGCGVNCGKTCSTYKVKNPICTLICRVNGCDCKDGFVLDANLNKCVLPKDCTPICGLNERYDGCVGFGCGHRNCSQLGKPILCIDPAPGACKSGCSCVDGYLRADNGTCVRQDQCPTSGCGGDPNAHKGCGFNCGNTCSTYKFSIRDKQILCPRIPCQPIGCDCNTGHVFDSNIKKCVVPKDCTPTCGRNERYDACTNGGCGHKNCSQLGQPQICIDVIESSCIKGCSCIDDYLRAENGTCIRQDQCPAPGCGGDPNAEQGCGFNCGRTCSTYKIKNKSLLCPRIQCKPDKCDCKDGFVLDKYRNKCVRPEQCTPDDQCPGQNEFFDMCISGCGNQSCDSIGKIIHCPIQPAVCRTGCRCKPGFYRNSTNVCVPESECPAPACPKGEIYSRCPTVKCEGDYCPKTRNSPLTCPVGIVCDPPRCVCGFNSKRDLKTGKCIPISSCPPFKCDGPNESYQACPATCPGEKCSDYIYSTRCPPYRIGIVVPCQPKCKCNKGYYRRDDGVCILGPQCGPKQTTSPVPLVTPVTDAPPSTDGPAVTTTATATTGGDGGGSNTVDPQAGLAKLQAGVASFDGKFLYDRMKSANGANLITSPFSVFTPLAQMALCANGESLKQLTTVLNVPSKEVIRAAFPLLASSFDGQTCVNFSMVAKVYSNKDYPLNKTFIKESREIVRSDAQELNFNAPAQSAATINSWVENKTNNRIKDLVKASDLSPLTRIVLVNAIYFKGQWEYLFDAKNTKDADFYLSDGTTKKTKLMYQEAKFNYGEVPDLGVTALEMFYKGKNFSMVIILPNEKDGIMKTTESLRDSANFNKVMGSLSSQKVKVYLPPFKINTETDLADILKQEGVTKIFDPTDSGLSGMLENPGDIYVSKAIQKAFIEVNEEGSEAAAANGVVISTRSLPLPPVDPIVFRADHPFLFYIRTYRNIVFCGSFVQ